MNMKDKAQSLFNNDRLAGVMREHRITQKALGEKLDVHRLTINRWITGKSEPDATQLFLICDLVSQTPYYFKREVKPCKKKSK